MADINATPTRTDTAPKRWIFGGAWGATLLLLLAVAVFDPAQFLPTVTFAGWALAGTAPFIAFAVLAVAYLKASGAETLLARAFEGNPARMVVMAALMGGLDYRASPDWGALLGYSPAGLADANHKAIDFLRDIAKEYTSGHCQRKIENSPDRC